MFVDESGFLLIPTRRRTWGPAGQAPVVYFNYRHDRVSAIAALSVSAVRNRLGLYIRLQTENFDALRVVRFLRGLLRHLRGQVIVLWDQARIHRSQRLEKLLERCPRLHLENFPGYAPELNPVEQLWGDFKRRGANHLFFARKEVSANVRASARRARRSQSRLRSFVLGSDLPSPPW